MRKIIFAFLIAFIIPSVVFAGGTSESIKIGVSGPYTGDLASFGIPASKAAELVIADWNERGGLLGREIEIVVEDDVCDPKVSPDVATKLVGEGVVAVVGHICSGATEAALGIYRDSNIVAISPSATNPPLTKSGDYPNFFRTIAPDDAQARLEIDFAKGLGVRRLAILHDRQSYGKGLAEFAKSFADADSSIEVVLFEGIQADAIDYSAILNKVANSNVDAILYGGYHPEASKLVTQMNEKGMDQIFISGDGVKDDTFIQIAGVNAEGAYASGPNDTTSDPIAVKAFQDHIDAFGEDPGTFFYNAYAATEALLQAIERAGSTDYEAIRSALQSDYVATSLGNISFDSKGDAIGVGFTMFQVQNGQYVPVQ